MVLVLLVCLSAADAAPDPFLFARALARVAYFLEEEQPNKAQEVLDLLAPGVERRSRREQAYYHRARGYLALWRVQPQKAADAFARALESDALTTIHAKEVRGNLVNLYVFTEDFAAAAELLAERKHPRFTLNESQDALLAHIFHRAGMMERALPALLSSMTGSAALERALQPGRDATPIVRVQPVYPRDAANRGITGWVILGFEVDEAGTPTSLAVVDSNPKGVFDEAALEAVRKWRYQPLVVEGGPVRFRPGTVKLEFRL